MSLIIEALKRARDDATRRQAASRGLPLAPVPRMRGRSRWLAIALVPLAAALVVCILLLIDLYSRIPETPTPPKSPSQDIETSPITAPAVEPAAKDPVAASPQPIPAPAVRPASPAMVTSVGEEMAPTAALPSSPQPTRPEPAAQPPESESARVAREFVGQAELLDGQLVDLEGIAWSESEPFALLNGKVVGVGELIRAYRVTEIGQDLVMLEQGDDRVVLRLE